MMNGGREDYVVEVSNNFRVWCLHFDEEGVQGKRKEDGGKRVALGHACEDGDVEGLGTACGEANGGVGQEEPVGIQLQVVGDVGIKGVDCLVHEGAGDSPEGVGDVEGGHGKARGGG